MADENDYWSIAPKSLYDLVNDKRRLRNKSPIDHGTMQTRLVLKCSVAMPGAIDFNVPELRLDAALLPQLEAVLNELFDLYLDNELKRYCKFNSPQAALRALEKEREAAANAAPEPSKEEEAAGLSGMLRRLFRR